MYFVILPRIIQKNLLDFGYKTNPMLVEVPQAPLIRTQSRPKMSLNLTKISTQTTGSPSLRSPNPIRECQFYRIFESSEGGALYLSNLISAQNQTLLQQHNIHHVVNACAILDFKEVEERPATFEKMGVTHHNYYFPDPPEQKDYFLAICDALPKIHGALKGGQNVLVHCYAGLSRSVGLVAAYLTVYQRDFLARCPGSCRGFQPRAFDYLESVKKIEPKLPIIFYIDLIDKACSCRHLHESRLTYDDIEAFSESSSRCSSSTPSEKD